MRHPPRNGLAKRLLSWTGTYFSVDGLVTIDGKPLDGGTVLFEMIGSGKSSQCYTARGSVDSDGRYRLSTFADGDGAPVGRYRVAIFAKHAGRLVEHPDAPSKPPIPLSYSLPETSGLEYEVKPGPNTFNIELSASHR